MRRPLSIALWLAVSASSIAGAQESRLAADFRRQGEHISQACDSFSGKQIAACAVELATGFPLHVALGSFAPQNGFGVGAAFVERYTPNERWRISWNTDAAASLSGAWRAGAYVKFIHTPVAAPVVVQPGGTSRPGGSPVREYPVMNVYAQTMTLPTLLFYGPPGVQPPEVKTAFEERQAIVGGGVVYPLSGVGVLRALRPALIGAVNGRFVRVRGRASGSVPAIDEVYGDTEAPGLASQPAFAEFEEGVRLRPEIFNGRVRFDYRVAFQQFVATGGSESSFTRWSIDLRHEVPIYRNAAPLATVKETNGPDECFTAVTSTNCPPVPTSRNRYGALGVRLHTIGSSVSGGNRVPFYFQPTLGGADINGQRVLPSAPDYRYRGPNLIVLQESFEHSLWGPLGVSFQADQGKVTERTADLGFGGLLHSYAVGLTLRAGGFPFVTLAFAWGTGGNHVIAAMDASLLGGSARPPM
jgi:hypothetical protein